MVKHRKRLRVVYGPMCNSHIYGNANLKLSQRVNRPSHQTSTFVEDICVLLSCCAQRVTRDITD
ncbi:Uncharacterized protein APZ42_020971 [Daphnia magna]|uniref:Uncharacterized protein n=1 Tax=Daphnia magna TaxID=35525 RepID=A0A164X2V4_9CRUS|nr:Uncharacterized protein APZ42_020971 [Daphnia magna]